MNTITLKREVWYAGQRKNKFNYTLGKDRSTTGTNELAENHMTKKRQNLTLSLVSKTKDCFGVWEVEVLINEKRYVYPIDSEYILRKVEKAIKRKAFGTALKLLSSAKIEGFNFYKEVHQHGQVANSVHS